MEWEQKVDNPVRITEEIQKGDSLFRGDVGILRKQFLLSYFYTLKSEKIRLYLV